MSQNFGVFMCVCVWSTAAVILSGRTTHDRQTVNGRKQLYTHQQRCSEALSEEAKLDTTCSYEIHCDQRTTDRQTDRRTDVPDALPEALTAASHAGTCLLGIYTVSKNAHFLIMYPHTTVGEEYRVFGSPVWPSIY